MGSYRFETGYASDYLIDMVKHSGMMNRMKHNGGDIVLFELQTGEAVSVHFIESALPLYEIRKTLEHNAAQGIYTLFILWADMMLPHDGQRYVAPDWTEALYTLYGGCVYAYEMLSSEAFIFPVFFRGEGQVRTAEFGKTVRFRQLTCRTVKTYLAGLHGEWKVADFGGVSGKAHDPEGLAAHVSQLEAHYVLLGVGPDDDLETVKKAYRLLARRYHPDVNTDQDAHEQMQRVNKAYETILASFREDER